MVGASGAEIASAIPGEEISLPENQVFDRFYSYLIGLVNANTCGVIDGNLLGNVLDGHRSKTAIPFDTIQEIRRECVSGSAVRDVSITFKGDLHTPVPYDILGYHPGSVAASHMISFREWYMPAQNIGAGSADPVELSQVYVFGVYDGWTVVDIDTWVDKLLGGFLDDTRITIMALFKYKGEWHGMAAGYGPSGEGRSGIFNFQRNKILFPTPQEMQAIAPYFRNFVVRTKHLNAPMPPVDQWKPARPNSRQR